MEIRFDQVEWAAEEARYWTDADGQEWVCVPTVPDCATADLLVAVGVEWARQSAREEGI